MKENSESGGIEDTFRRYDSVRLLSSLLLLPSCTGVPPGQGDHHPPALPHLRHLPHLLLPPLHHLCQHLLRAAPPASPAPGRAQPPPPPRHSCPQPQPGPAYSQQSPARLCINRISEGESPPHPPPHEWAIQAVHWCACLANSVGLVLTLVTLSSNCLQLTTSLLDGYVSGQVDPLLLCCPYGVTVRLEFLCCW